MNAPARHLPVLTLFGCVAFKCVMTPAACAARHLARGEARSGHTSRPHPTCAGCSLGAHHAGVELPPPPPAAPSKPAAAPCSKCHARPAAKPFRGAENATPQDQHGWCAACRLRARVDARHERVRPRRAHSAAPACERCHERPAARVLHTTRPGREGWCAVCRVEARHEVARAGSGPCEKCRKRPAARVLPSTHKGREKWCVTCRDTAATQDARRKARGLLGEESEPEECARCHERPAARVRANTRADLHAMCVPCRTAVRGGAELELEAETRAPTPPRAEPAALTLDAFEALFAPRVVAKPRAGVELAFGPRSVIRATDPCARAGCPNPVGDARSKRPELRELCYGCRARVRTEEYQARRAGVAA